MREYMIRRMLLAIPTIALVLLATFAIVRAVPGDIVQLMVAEQQYAVDEDALRKELGLADPVVIQFGKYVADLAQGDLGNSLWTKQPVRDELQRRLPVSFELGLYSIIIGLMISLPIGVFSAIRQDTPADYIARSVAILGISVPNFYMATLLVVFPVIWFGWAPPLLYKSWGDGPIAHLYFFLFPAIILGIGLAGGVMRMTRTMMLEVLRQDYIRTAWSKGVRERTVIMRHALKNALIPVVTIVGLQVGLAVSGTVIIESIFNMPGIGRFFYDAIYNRDYPAIQGVVFVIACVIIFTNIAVDLTYAYLDPRIRYR